MKFIDPSLRARGQNPKQRPAVSRLGEFRKETAAPPSAARLAAELAFSRTGPADVTAAAPVVQVRRSRAVKVAAGEAKAVGSTQALSAVDALVASDATSVSPSEGRKAPRVFRVEPRSEPDPAPSSAAAPAPVAPPTPASAPPHVCALQQLAAGIARLDQTIEAIRSAQAFHLQSNGIEGAWRALSERALKLQGQARALRAKPDAGLP